MWDKAVTDLYIQSSPLLFIFYYLGVFSFQIANLLIMFNRLSNAIS